MINRPRWHTGFVDFDDTIIANFLEQAEKRDLVGAEAGPCVVMTDVVDKHRRRRKSSEEKTKPEVLASLQLHVRCLRHSLLVCALHDSAVCILLQRGFARVFVQRDVVSILG